MSLLLTGAEESAEAARRAGVELKADRVLLPQTRSRREVLLDSFEKWLIEKMRITLEQLLEDAGTSPELVSECLIEYGKELYYAGKPYGRYSETINAVASRKVSLKKALTGAWDLAFAWVVDEPHAHHPAMPLSIVLAFASLSLLWGWSVEAALLLMTWTGILRIGEVLAAQRGDLILPQDSAPGIEYALLQIRLPKTRGSAARHQSARIDPKDVDIGQKSCGLCQATPSADTSRCCRRPSACQFRRLEAKLLMISPPSAQERRGDIFTE